MSKEYQNITGETRKQIADITVCYMKNRMLIKQRCLERTAGRIDFEPFMALYCKYNELLKHGKEQEGEELKKLLTEDDDGNVPLKYLVDVYKRELARLHSGRIVLTEEQIDEILGYVRESIETCGLGTIATFENDGAFLSDTLGRLCYKLEKDPNSKEKLDRVNKYCEYANISSYEAFCRTIMGSVSIGYDSIFEIFTHENKKVCDFSLEGVNIASSNALDTEEIFLLDDLYVGNLTVTISKSGAKRDIFGIFKKVKLDGREMVQAVSINNEFYELNNQCGNQSDFVTLTESLEEHLKRNGLYPLCEPIYTENDFFSMWRAYHKYFLLTDELKEKMEKAIEAAVEWWAEAVLNPSFDTNIPGEIGANISALLKHNNELKLAPNERDISLFKTILSTKIKKRFLTQGFIGNKFYIRSGYHPEPMLEEATKEARIEGTFPFGTTMSVSIDKVSVNTSEGIKVLYSSKTEDFGDGSIGQSGDRQM